MNDDGVRDVTSAGIREVISAGIREVPDFPTEGILFRDIAPLLADATAFNAVVGHLAKTYGGGVDAVAGIEARGFLLAAPLAAVLGVGVIAVRKAGKLPPPTERITYDLEYGSAELEVPAAGIRPGSRVVLVDDVLATGGTARAAWDLLERVGVEVVEFAVLLELSGLGGRRVLDGRGVRALMTD